MRSLLLALTQRPLFLASPLLAVLGWPLDPPLFQGHTALAATLGAALAISAIAGEKRLFVKRIALLGGLALALATHWKDPAAGLAFALAGAAAWRWTRGSGPIPLGALALGTAALLAVPQELPFARSWAVLGALALAGADALARRKLAGGDLVDALLDSPARLMVTSFAALSFLGGALLVSPFSGTGSVPISFLDALFTSVSATCVTGLAVLDTPSAFSWAGQAVILALIQAGGLGVMTFSSAIALVLGRRLGVREEAVAAELLGGGEVRRDLDYAVRTVFRVTFWAEALGALALTALFAARGDPLATALWRGIFTSVSAFCNAGFALQSDSLVGYADSPAVLAVVGLLITAGGLGPMVMVALPRLARGRGSLHAKLVVVTSAVLTFGGAAAFLALEWGHTLAGFGILDKASNAIFQAVTFRTAGFNSIDFGAIQPGTWTLSLFSMFIGGSPGSTAGGMKTTTLAVLVLAVFTAIRGRSEAIVGGRRLPHRTLYEATAISSAGILSALAVLFSLQITQPIPLDRALFEVVSALGTVGLSMNTTGQLDGIGKIVIMLAMFAGRVGPLTLFIFLAGRPQAARGYPIEPVSVG